MHGQARCAANPAASFCIAMVAVRHLSSYIGAWSDGGTEAPGGRLLVQGTLKWASGERYDGEWRVGEESGVGIYTWPDGSTYNGFWSHGKKHGISSTPISVAVQMMFMHWIRLMGRGLLYEGVGVFRPGDGTAKRSTISTEPSLTTAGAVGSADMSDAVRDALEPPGSPAADSQSAPPPCLWFGALIQQQHPDTFRWPLLGSA